MNERKTLCHVLCRLLAVLIVFGVMFAVPYQSHAVQYQQKKGNNAADEAPGSWSVDIGVAGQYLWWQPAFRGELRGDQQAAMAGLPTYISGKQFTMAPSLAAGPVVVIAMPRGFSLNTGFLWSSYTAHSQYLQTLNPTNNLGYISIANVRRWELAAAIDYALTGILKLSAGILSSGYTLEKLQTITLLSDAVKKRKDMSWSLGPEFVVRVLFHLAGPLYLGADVAAFYLFTRYFQGSEDAVNIPSGISFRNSGVDFSYHGLGMELASQLILHQDPSHLTIALGFRYRFVKYMRGQYSSSYVYSTSGGINPSLDKLHVVDHLFGFTFSVTQVFDF